MTQPAPLTLEQFFALPPGPPYYELEGGVLIPVARPAGREKRLALYLAPRIDRYVTEYELGRVWPEIEVVLPGAPRVYAPDIAFLTMAYQARYSEEHNRIYGPVDLAVEIVSPATKLRDLTVKLRAYQEARVPWCWVIDPDEYIVQEYKLIPEGYLLNQSLPLGPRFAPGLFPGLTLDLAELLDLNAPQPATSL